MIAPMPDTYLSLAQRALKAYDLGDMALAYLQHSDSITFKASRSGKPEAYLLRIHLPVTPAMGEHGADPAALRSELQWLEALNQDTSLDLQSPIPNREGQWVTPILDGTTQKELNCTLLSWLEGEPYRRELENEALAGQLGVILATLHQHASRWQPPAGFTRPLRDAAYFNAMLHGLSGCVTQGRVSAQDFAELEQAVEKLTQIMCSLGQDPLRCGVLHADAHKGNLLIHHGQVRLIDFSFCAVGDYMFDLSIAMGDLRPELHPAFLAGYQSLRSLPPGWQRLVEAFYLGMMVGTFNYLAARPETQPILNRRVPQIAQGYAARFNRGESFWFAG